MTIPSGNYLAQLRHAVKQEMNYYQTLKSQGWVQDSSGAWTHPDKPGMIIMPG